MNNWNKNKFSSGGQPLSNLEQRLYDVCSKQLSTIPIDILGDKNETAVVNIINETPWIAHSTLEKTPQKTINSTRDQSPTKWFSPTSSPVPKNSTLFQVGLFSNPSSNQRERSVVINLNSKFSNSREGSSQLQNERSVPSISEAPLPSCRSNFQPRPTGNIPSTPSQKRSITANDVKSYMERNENRFDSLLAKIDTLNDHHCEIPKNMLIIKEKYVNCNK